MKQIRLIELFAGYGSQLLALKRIDKKQVPYFVCDNSTTAIKCYNALHNTLEKPSDITQIHYTDINVVEKDKYLYIMTYSFPCTDISYSGKREGFEKGSNTRSSLLWEVIRILHEMQEHDQLPQILIMENVAAILSKRYEPIFTEVKQLLSELGYSNFVQVLNAADYGCPQQRKRCFMVSVLNAKSDFVFPPKQELFITAQDIITSKLKADPKLFLSNEITQRLLATLRDKDKETIANGPIKRFCSTRGRNPKNQGYRGKREKNVKYVQCLEVKENYELSNTLTSVQKDNYVLHKFGDKIALRKPSIREYGLLMGLEPYECEKLEDLHLTQHEYYLTYANSIVVDVLQALFRQILIYLKEYED